MRNYFLLLFVWLLAACGKSDGMEESVMPSNPHGTEILSPDIELTEETVLINNAQLAFLQTVDEENATLKFSSLLPEEHIPKVGQILLRIAPTEKLPYGFIGRVTSIKTVGGNYTVVTEAPTLREAFDKLTINYDARRDSQSRTRAEIIEETEFVIDENGYLCFNKELSLNQNGVSVACGVSLGLNPVVNLCLDAKNNIDIQEYGFGITASSNIRYGLTMEGLLEKELDLGNGYMFNLPGSTPAIQGALQFSWVTKAEGHLRLSTAINTSVKHEYRISKNNVNAQAEQNPNGTTQIGVVIDPEFKCEGEIFAGLGVGVELRLFGRKELAVGIGNKIGPRVGAEVDLLANHEVLYEQYRDTSVELQGLVQWDAYAQAKLFGWELEWEKELGEPWVFWDSPRYIFPSFSGQYAVNESNQAVCSVELDRNLLIQGAVGISQYDTSEKLCNSSGPLSYLEAKTFQNPLTASFDHAQDCTYWTYMKWGNLYVKCKELEPRYSIVGHWESIMCEWSGGKDTEDTDEFWIFNEDGSGYHMGIDDYYSGEYTQDEMIEYSVDYETMTIVWHYKYPYDPGDTIRILSLSSDRLKFIQEEGYKEYGEIWTFKRIK